MAKGGHIAVESDDPYGNAYRLALSTVRKYRCFVEPNPGFALAIEEIDADRFKTWMKCFDE